MGRLVSFTPEEATQARERLLELIKPGSRIYTVNRKRYNTTGTQYIDLFFITKDAEPRPFWIGQLVAAVLGIQFDESWHGVYTGGHGMDYGADLVLRLSLALFDDMNQLIHQWI